MTYRLSVCSSLVFLLVTACGGSSTPSAESPDAAASESGGEPTSETGTEADAAPEADAEVPAEPEAPKDDGPQGPSGGRTPKDIVGAEGSRFVLNFNSSEIGIKAGEECDATHKNDPKKRNECVKNARARVKEDVMQFEISQTGRWVWTTSSQKGSTLNQLRKTNFEWGAETKNSIELKPSSGDAVVLGVPNNYSIVFDHPTHGKLTYDSKRND